MDQQEKVYEVEMKKEESIRAGVYYVYFDNPASTQPPIKLSIQLAHGLPQKLAYQLASRRAGKSTIHLTLAEMKQCVRVTEIQKRSFDFRARTMAGAKLEKWDKALIDIFDKFMYPDGQLPLVN